MNIDTDVIRKLSHGGLKTLISLKDLLEFYDVDSKEGLHDPKIRKIIARSLLSLSQAILDLRTLAACADLPPDSWGVINWRVMAERELAGRSSGNIHFTVEDGDYDGWGQPDLIGSALRNFVWFAKVFWKDSPPKIQLMTQVMEGSPRVKFLWNFGDSIKVSVDFSSFQPFYPMFPEETLAHYKSTGLVLYTVQQILMLHGGALKAQSTENNLILEWSCPNDSRQK